MLLCFLRKLEIWVLGIGQRYAWGGSRRKRCTMSAKPEVLSGEMSSAHDVPHVTMGAGWHSVSILDPIAIRPKGWYLPLT